MGSISDSDYLQKLVTDAGRQKHPIVVHEGFSRVEINSDGKLATIKLFANDGLLCRALAEYAVAADGMRSKDIAEIAKKIKNRVNEIGKNLHRRVIEKCHRCYDTIVTISNQQSKAVPFDRLLSALKAMANYAEVNGLGETDVIDKDFIARISQQILLEEPIKLVGERLKVSPEGMAKFNTCVLLCIDRENIEIFSSIANPRYESKALSARETDYLKWSRDVIQHVSSAPSPAPNTAIFSAAGVKDFTTQKVILRSLMRFCELVEVETRH